MAYYVTGIIHNLSYDEAVTTIYNISPQIPISIIDHKDETYSIVKLSNEPRQHGQHAYRGEVIEAVCMKVKEESLK